MNTIIDKSFSFCYGHRVHNQRLDTRFTDYGNNCLACRHLHGHEGLIKVFLESSDDGKQLEDTGMITDFKNLGWFKNFLDDTLDHKFIMDIKDPLFQEEFSLCYNKSNANSSPLDDTKSIKMKEGYYVPDLTHIRNILDNNDSFSPSEVSAIFEKYEGSIFVDFVPTSENLAAWLLTVVQKKMKDLKNVRVKAIEYWETPKSHCRVEV